jgi:cytochrome c
MRRIGCGVSLLAVVVLGANPAHAADVALGQYLANECVTCHRADGEVKGIPSIIGWPVDAFITALKGYKDKIRPNPIMQTISARLTDEEMAALAAYYESLQPVK